MSGRRQSETIACRRGSELEVVPALALVAELPPCHVRLAGVKSMSATGARDSAGLCSEVLAARFKVKQCAGPRVAQADQEAQPGRLLLSTDEDI